MKIDDVHAFNSQVLEVTEAGWTAKVLLRGQLLVGSYAEQPLSLLLETGGQQVQRRSRLHLRFASMGKLATKELAVGETVTVNGVLWRIASVKPDFPAQKWVCELEDPNT